jgi:hypothetical protein
MRGPRRILELTLGLLALATTISMTATLPAAAADAPASPPSLQGTWTLNEDLTARMRESDQQHGAKGGAGGGFHHGGGGGGGRRGGGGGRGGGTSGDPGSSTATTDATADAHPENQHPSFAALQELTIAQQGHQVTITDKDGHSRVLTADGSKVKDPKALGGPAETQASWDKDGSLVVQTKPDKGPKRTESYIVSDDGKHLYIVLDVEGDGKRPEFKIRRAYDPAVPAEKPAAPAESPSEGETAVA